MRALVIYDLTGYIWNIVYGADSAPDGLLSLWVDIPEDADLTAIDVTDPANHKPVFNYRDKNTDIKVLTERIENIENKLNPLFDFESATLEETKEYMLKQFSKTCTSSIYYGQEVETSEGKYLFSFNNYDQINLKDAFDLALLTKRSVPYHANGIDCMMWNALDIVKIYCANAHAKIYHTTYCNLLNNICRSSNDKDYIFSLHYGMELPSKQNLILYSIMAKSEEMFNKVIADFELSYTRLNTDTLEHINEPKQ